MKYIISSSKVQENILVDDDMYEYLNQWKWYTSGDYPQRTGRKHDGELNGKTIHMHRVVMEHPSGLVDHKDRNKLNCTRENLRLATTQQNAFNKGSKSGYKGLSYKKEKYEVSFNVDGKNFYIGRYSNEIAGANAYNHYVKDVHGEFVLLNDVPFMSIEECNQYKCKVTSKYKGVNLDVTGKWMARIRNKFTNKREYLGTFILENEACLAYNKRAIEIYGEGCKELNTIGNEVLV